MHISIRALLFASLLYLLLPFCIFLFGWTYPFIGVICSFILFILFIKYTKEVKGTITISPFILIIGGSLLLLWTVLSGAGHRNLLSGDFYKHSAILNDLISYDWPVTYTLSKSSQHIHLVYYFAYYLPSAVVGKLFGWEAANCALFFWTYSGIVLVFIWFISLVRKNRQIVFCFLFPFFSGLDVVGRLIMGNKIVNFSDWEWWGRNWQYSGNTTLLFYVPQHALAGWICMGIVMYSILKKSRIPLQELLLVSTLLWSPFVFIGCFPFYAWMIYKKMIPLKIVPVGVAVCIFLIQSVFILSNMTFLTPETASNKWLWQTENLLGSWALIRLSLFYILEFGAFIILLLKAKKSSPILIIACIILLLLPWYKIGQMNDFAMRSSIPSLFVICIYWLMYFIEKKKNRLILIFSWLLFCLGGIYSFVLMGNAIRNFSYKPLRYSLAKLDTPSIRKQYLGRADSLFFILFHPINGRQKIGELSLQK